MSHQKIKIGLAGFGTVGGGVWKHLLANASLMACRTGFEFEISKIAVRSREKALAQGVPASLLTTNWIELVQDPEISVIVELMGGTTDARALIISALQAGKHVVTANKALLCSHGSELTEIACNEKRHLLFEASVAGGIPIVKALREGLIANRILSLHGIINGTCNYILTQMRDRNEAFSAVLEEAKRLGYAEADDRLDVDGHDTAHKAAVLAALAYGYWIPELYTEGIRHVEQQDLNYARQLGYELKLLAIIKHDDGDQIEARVHPTLVPLRHVLASINGVYNAISVRGDVVGDTLFYGRGAGADATASAVLSDIAEIVRNPQATCQLSTPLSTRVKPMDEVVSRYYLRLMVLDQPGVLAQVATVLGKRGIGISSVIQPEVKAGESVPLIILLHDAQEKQFHAARTEIEKLEVIKGPPVWLRVEDFG